MGNQKKKATQAPLFSGSVSGDYVAPDEREVKVWEEVVKTGDSMTLNISGAHYVSDPPARMVLFDNTDENETVSLTVWQDAHPDSKYQDGTTDMTRLGNAVARATSALDSHEDLESRLKEGTFMLTVTGTDFNGGFARLWTVTRS
jgi:hypothetical protein